MYIPLTASKLPPETAVDRMRHYRQRKKAADPEGWTAKNAGKYKKYWQGMTAKQRKKSNALAAIRKQCYRARRSDQGVQQPVYKSRQALGKAVTKTNHALPHSPRKRQAVVANFAQNVGLNLAVPAAKKPSMQ